MTDKQTNNITKEQAIRILHPDTRVEAIDDYEEAGNYEHAYDTAILMAIAALRTTQLDENGLARCGCGGKAVVWEGRMHSDTYYVQCLFCGVRTVDKVKKSDAIREFNTAMGWKGGEE